MKFESLVEKTRALGIEHVATGHYARKDRGPRDRPPPPPAGRATRARTSRTSSSASPRSSSARAVFPVGRLTKDEVRRMAAERGLPTADKPESQEICFVPDGDYAGLRGAAGAGPRTARGPIVDRGRARRSAATRACTATRSASGKGLGLTRPRPLYVLAVLPAVAHGRGGRRGRSSAATGFVARDVNWLSIAAARGRVRAAVKIRYRARRGRRHAAPAAGRAGRGALRRAAARGHARARPPSSTTATSAWAAAGSSRAIRLTRARLDDLVLDAQPGHQRLVHGALLRDLGQARHLAASRAPVSVMRRVIAVDHAPAGPRSARSPPRTRARCPARRTTSRRAQPLRSAYMPQRHRRAGAERGQEQRVGIGAGVGAPGGDGLVGDEGVAARPSISWSRPGPIARSPWPSTPPRLSGASGRAHRRQRAPRRLLLRLLLRVALAFRHDLRRRSALHAEARRCLGPSSATVTYSGTASPRACSTSCSALL